MLKWLHKVFKAVVNVLEGISMKKHFRMEFKTHDDDSECQSTERSGILINEI